MIVSKTGFEKLPTNCMECINSMNFMLQCNLPLSSRDYARVLKPYLSKRHRECPLMEIPDKERD